MAEDLKKLCAKEALKYIKNNSIVGLGGGSTISHLINYIKEDRNIKVKVVTPSEKTRMLCIENGLEVLYTSDLDKVDVAFDGCDEVDHKLNALKSGGGIHTKEKLIASMAEEYVLLVDESKVSESLAFKHPVVLEILRDGLKYVEKEVRKLGGEPSLRTSTSKDGFTISDNGNLLMDVKFEKTEDITGLENKLMKIKGVIDTSLFVNVVTKAIVISESGVRTIEAI
ncbi:ribose 5-phosphate isomerase A [Clostridium sp. 19966]|uniref:ribose 5-phosphate isomerase A n=1 Tax=Clostridium sp. 19966 TaxID=2768166 RepID=UPI0028DEE5A5|nr:ribose 5-phosphate isomerase A [Clostridium sp. 19966]MDT8719401.1 ribose 5-phosphate isomerase A [Clostridium sp. 19966]